MDVVHERCAGLDVSKTDAKVCLLVSGAGRGRAVETVTTWSSMTGEILRLRDYLARERVTCVVMEATGDYWKPFYYVLEDLEGVEVMLVNAREAKNLPGRKTDVSDAKWLAQLAAHGLLRASFVPPPPIRQLRDLTRTRTVLARERSREVQRLEKLLEDAGIKLSSVASDIMGVSGRAMLEALAAGQRDPGALADLAVRRLRRKVPQLQQALTGRFTEHHAFLVRLHLGLIDGHTKAIGELTGRIEAAMEPFRAFRELICTIPGVAGLAADVITAETGADMSRFPTAGHLASWAGVSPGHHESAGRAHPAATRPGDAYLKGAMGTCAMSVARTNTFLGARYRRLAARVGRSKALVATERSLLAAIWAMARDGTLYQDPGPDHYTRLQPKRAKKHAIHQLETLGYTVTLEPTG